jgi:hypothetical protein
MPKRDSDSVSQSVVSMHLLLADQPRPIQGAEVPQLSPSHAEPDIRTKSHFQKASLTFPRVLFFMMPKESVSS